MLCDGQSSRSSHGSLPHIESPETIGFQFQSSGNVQCIESAGSERGYMLLGKLDASRKSVLWQAGKKPYTRIAIRFEIGKRKLRFYIRQPASEDLLENGIRHFGTMKGCNQHMGAKGQSPCDFWRMDVAKVRRR